VLIVVGICLLLCVKRVPEGHIMVVLGYGREPIKKVLLGGRTLVVPVLQTTGLVPTGPMTVRLPDGEEFRVRVGSSPRLVRLAAERLLQLSRTEIVRICREMISGCRNIGVGPDEELAKLGLELVPPEKG
jgi:uncharacterized membrane protein YqiK